MIRSLSLSLCIQGVPIQTTPSLIASLSLVSSDETNIFLSRARESSVKPSLLAMDIHRYEFEHIAESDLDSWSQRWSWLGVQASDRSILCGGRRSCGSHVSGGRGGPAGGARGPHGVRISGLPDSVFLLVKIVMTWGDRNIGPTEDSLKEAKEVGSRDSREFSCAAGVCEIS